MSLFKGIIETSSIEDKYELLSAKNKKVIDKMIEYLLIDE